MHALRSTSLENRAAAAAVSTATEIAISVAGVIVLLALLLLLRVLLRREPRPPGWRRYRLGVFVERDAADREPAEPAAHVMRPRGEDEDGNQDE